ncbi:hypothetical protein OAK06_06655 [Gammaproteobacteria bacterium]|nr:hypothetical protein [Gammaproteobacteria bacterium]|tara:strand:- start:2903 stop:3379 length:477 start_codon:yes stop_codon:yes gene_type:complete
MIKKILFFLLSILLTSFLVGAQTTIVNLMWLSSVEMPVTLTVLISSLFQDFYMLSLSPVVGMLPVSIPPLLPTLILLGFLISFSVTWLALKWVKIEKKYAYGIAGAVALFFIVYLMPVVFFGVDMLAGARTPLGKVSLIICGYLGGHFMGSKLNKTEL